MTKVPVPLTVPPVTLLPGCLFDGDRLARHHRLVHGVVPLDDDAVDGHSLAGTHAQPIADVHVFERHVVFRAVGSIRRAVFGASPSSFRMAALVRLRARSSSTWPSSTSTTMTAAGSK